ncbi:hypothetical protein HY29_01475 [Hyphomonas beringensis]|uniref:Uncharacterized protein n=1 Tax=Hyphomonas beringensis TaxID=1280946 RepID=A0A062U3I1_9PROT|nr:hypothetical protein HY29_01475 [Hyphomonas beringensis]
MMPQLVSYGDMNLEALAAKNYTPGGYRGLAQPVSM